MKFPDEIIHKIKTAISNVLIIEIEQLNNISANEDLSYLGLNSFNTLSLIIFIEKEFGIEFDYDDLTFENVKTIDNIVEIIQKQLQYK